jgi:hypothetical protein
MRLMARRLSAILILAVASTTAIAQSRLKDEGAARKLSDEIMRKISAGDIEGGLRLAKPYLIIPEAELEALIGQTKLQVPAMTQRFGKNVGYELVREEKAGTVLLRIVQLSLHEKHATRWNFYFYRTPTGWVLNTFQFDDNIRAVFPGGG